MDKKGDRNLSKGLFLGIMLVILQLGRYYIGITIFLLPSFLDQLESFLNFTAAVVTALCLCRTI